jgi:hypothetical protein
MVEDVRPEAGLFIATTRGIGTTSQLPHSEIRHRPEVAPTARPQDHRCGGLNVLHEHGEQGSESRYQTRFTRMAAMGLSFVGPQHPNGDQCSPWPAELPQDSKNVPMFRTRRQTLQALPDSSILSFRRMILAGRLRVCARNAAAEWGPSDHCCLEIELESPR